MVRRSFTILGTLLLLFLGLGVPVTAEGEPQADSCPWDGPEIAGNYQVKCNLKIYDWMGNKVQAVTEGYWEIQQYYFPGGCPQPKAACAFTIRGLPPEWGLGAEIKLQSPNSYIGPFERKSTSGTITNKPRFSQWGDKGAFCNYDGTPSTYYTTWVINAVVKVDRKTGQVKSIKGTINGWGEFGPQMYPLMPEKEPGVVLVKIPRFGQMECKFTATPE